MTYKQIQDDLIRKYRIDICDGTRCEDGDWSRTHAHPKQRRVCKWRQANSVVSTFELLHEIGHIENNNTSMRRCEQEYAATMWAMAKCNEYHISIPDRIIASYQQYIDNELARGIRRGGSGYPKSLKLHID